MPARSTLSTVDYIRENSASEPNTGCWLWMLAVSPTGYAICPLRRFRDTGTRLAHRISYTAFNGPIPPGLDLDHLCRVRCCVNPDHLEPVTRKENLRRGAKADRNGILKATCKRGHPMTPDNLFIVKCNGVRLCRICNNARTHKYMAEKKARLA